MGIHQDLRFFTRTKICRLLYWALYPGFVWRFLWEFPKIRGTLFWGPYNKDPTI